MQIWCPPSGKDHHLSSDDEVPVTPGHCRALFKITLWRNYCAKCRTTSIQCGYTSLDACPFFTGPTLPFLILICAEPISCHVQGSGFMNSSYNTTKRSLKGSEKLRFTRLGRLLKKHHLCGKSGVLHFPVTCLCRLCRACRGVHVVGQCVFAFVGTDALLSRLPA